VRLIVSGASGQLGRLVVAGLLESVPIDDLILVSRSPDSLDWLAKLGATVRHGDFDHPESLPSAFAGGQRALIISTLGPRDTVAAHRAAFQAAARAGVERIVYTSVMKPEQDNPFPPARNHGVSERDLRDAGVPWTILRNALYAELRARIGAKYIQDGRWTTNMGDGAHAFVARTDCAAAAAAALTGAGRDGKTYDITGPELIDARRYGALLDEFGGRSVTRVDVDDDAYERYRAAFAADPENAAYFELYGGTGRAIRTGYLDVIGTGVQDLTGRAPVSLRELF
jgi:NAD(P)H dehydrogenase (quinone)